MKAKAHIFGICIEVMLRTVTDAPHAASIAGDLIEGARRSPLRALADLGSSIAWLAVDALRLQPLRTALLLIQGLITWAACYLPLRILLSRSGWLTTAPPGAGLGHAAQVAGLLAGALILSSLGAGVLLGALQRRSTMNPALPLAAIFVTLMPALVIADLLAGALLWHCLLTYLLVIPLCYVVPLLAGPALVGQRAPAQ